MLRRHDLYLQRALRRHLVVHLKGGVVNPEALPERSLEMAPPLVAVRPSPHDDVGREGGEP